MTPSTSSPRLSPSEKRRSRYGRDEFALDPNFLHAATLDASSPAPSKQRHQTVRLSAFEIVIDISSPTSPISDAPPLSSTITTPPRHSNTRDQRSKSPPRPRTRSPTPSLSSMSACSSNEIPTTPLTSDDDDEDEDDDEWPSFLDSSPQLRKAPAAQRVQIHQPMISKSMTTASPNVSSATAIEFTLADLEQEWTDEDEMSWYARELEQVVSLASPCTPSYARPRADSLFPPPSRTSDKGPRSRMSKPLPAVPRTPGPNPQLDPTFPYRRQPLPSPVPSTTTTTTLAVRKSLKITVPRAPPRTPLPMDVADIFDDIDAWSIFVPTSGTRSTDPNSSTSTNIGAELSPPRIPETPMSAYSAYDPVELIIDYATQPSPLPPSDDNGDNESWPTEEKLRSRWSCSTIAKTPTSPSASEKLRFHLGSVARRVRARRAGGDVAVPKTHARSSSEPVATPGADDDGNGVGVRSESGHEEPDAESCLRRKPIPLELFLR